MTLITDPRRFLYHDGQLDPDTARRVTAQLLSRCDDGELYLQYRASESFGFDDGRLKTADYSTEAGFGLRGVSGEMTGFAHANEISEAAIRRAGETLTLLDPAKGAMSAAPRQNNRHLYTDGDPMGLIPFADKVALCQQIDAAACAKAHQDATGLRHGRDLGGFGQRLQRCLQRCWERRLQRRGQLRCHCHHRQLRHRAV